MFESLLGSGLLITQSKYPHENREERSSIVSGLESPHLEFIIGQGVVVVQKTLPISEELGFSRVLRK